MLGIAGRVEPSQKTSSIYELAVGISKIVAVNERLTNKVMGNSGWDQRTGRRIIRLGEMKHSILLCIGWLAIGVAVVAAMVCFEMHWNFFDFHPKWDAEALEYGVLVLLALAGSWFLARASRDRGSQVLSLIVCIALLAFGVLVCRPEPVTQGFLGRDTPSPLWFRGGMAMLLLLPGGFWILWPFRWWTRKAQGAPPNGGPAKPPGNSRVAEGPPSVNR